MIGWWQGYRLHQIDRMWIKYSARLELTPMLKTVMEWFPGGDDRNAGSAWRTNNNLCNIWNRVSSPHWMWWILCWLDWDAFHESSASDETCGDHTRHSHQWWGNTLHSLHLCKELNPANFEALGIQGGFQRRLHPKTTTDAGILAFLLLWPNTIISGLEGNLASMVWQVVARLIPSRQHFSNINQSAVYSTPHNWCTLLKGCFWPQTHNTTLALAEQFGKTVSVSIDRPGKLHLHTDTMLI